MTHIDLCGDCGLRHTSPRGNGDGLGSCDCTPCDCGSCKRCEPCPDSCEECRLGSDWDNDNPWEDE